MKGAKEIVATSPYGTRATLTGANLLLAHRASNDSYTVHDADTLQLVDCGGGKIVGIIPVDWHIELIHE